MKHIKLFEQFLGEETVQYPSLYSDTQDPFYLYVKSPEEAYYIGFNPVSKPDETGRWPISNIDKIEGSKNVDAAIHDAMNPPADAKEHGMNPDPMEQIEDMEKIEDIGNKIEKWGHKFMKEDITDGRPNDLLDTSQEVEDAEEEELEEVSKEAQEYISNKISKLNDEGYENPQAVAMAYSYAKKAGYRVPKK